jgi:hypothetical protein
MVMFNKSVYRISVLIVVWSLFFRSPAMGAETFHQEWWQVAFETPTAFSEPIRIGLGAVALVNPVDQGLGQGRMEIRLVLVPQDLQEGLGNTDAAILAFVKSTFLEIDQQPQRIIERTFLGQKTQGEVIMTTVPREAALEVHLLKLPGGDKMVLGFYREPSVTEEEASQIMEMVAATFRTTE